MRERDIAQALAEREGGQCEVRTPAGNIDVLTPKYVYEVKVARNWKAALGQVLAYARAYPDRKPRLYLFGDKGAITQREIEEHCRAAGVGVVWHRDEEAPPRQPQEPRSTTDAMSLQLTAVDTTYGIRSTSTFRLPTPVALIPAEALDVYADEALAVFDVILDNALTIKVTSIFGGERRVARRERPAIRGQPVCYQLTLTISTREAGKPFRASLAGVRAIMPSGMSLSRPPSRGEIPELRRLFGFITHEQFPWCDQFGHRAEQVLHANYASRGITKTRDGYRIGRR